ncbi:MAG: ROK family protein [Actinomycetota bacterium]
MTELTAGVDLGGTKIQTVVLRDEHVVGGARVPTPHTGADDVVASIVSTIHDALGAADAELPDLVAVGIGSPGAIDAARGMVSESPNVPGFQEKVDLGPKVSAACGGVLVAIDNDVRVAMLGEHQRGAGRPYRNVIGVFVGTGVGGGLVLDGKLRDGRGAAGEIGHASVTPAGRRCSCGRHGHLEAYAGRGCMETRARDLHAKGKKTILFDIMEKQGKPRISSGVIAKALEKQDRMAVSLVDDAVWALGIALASTQNLLDLEAFIIGGGLGDRLGQPFVDRIVAAMQPRLFVPEQPPVVLTTELGDVSGAVGAAVLAGRAVSARSG